MADSPFVTAINVGNDAFAAAVAEKFSVLRGGNTGEYDAVSVEDVTAGRAVAPGGLRGDNTVLVFIRRTVLAASAITDGTVLLVRDKRVRVNTVADEGDNTLMLECGTAGIKLS